MASLSSSCIKCGNNDTHVRLQLKTYGKSLICSDFPDIAVFAVKFQISRLSRSISRYRDRDGQIPDIAIATAKFPISRYRDDRELSVCLVVGVKRVYQFKFSLCETKIKFTHLTSSYHRNLRKALFNNYLCFCSFLA